MKKLLTCLLVFCTLQYATAQSCADGSFSFDDDIAPILTANCGGCHGGNGGFNVSTFANVLAGGTGACGGPGVTPGDATAAGSSIIDKLQWVNGGPNASCGSNMPLGGSITVPEFLAISAWIAAGAQESCPAPPANDLCADAIPLTVDPTETCVPSPVTNVDATDSGELPAPTCASYSGGDAWYSVTVPASGNVTVETNNDGSGTITDSGMSLYSGTCGALTQIECDDDDSADGLFSLIELTGLTPGDVIFVRVWEFGNDVFGTFSVCAYEPLPPPPGDECVVPIPYPGDVATGTCVTGFDFTVFGDSGNPSPTCDFGGDAVAWFSWTAPIITAAGDPIDLVFDDGDGQAMDCDIGIEAYEVDCTTPASNCLGNISGTLTGLVQGTDYVLLIYDDSAPEASCDFCLSIACSAPIITASAICVPGDESGFYVEVDVANIGVGNTGYTVDVGGPQANITATGLNTYGPFPSGTPVDVVITGVDDPACGFTLTGLDRDCTCPPDLALAGPVGPYCTTDAAVAITYAPTGPFESSVTITNTADGGFDGEVGFGLYSGTWDDGTVLGLPPAGTGLFGTDSEASIETSTPGANDVTTAGNFGGDPLVPGFTQTVGGLAPGNYTIYLIDDFGDGWNGTQAVVTDECGNVITTEQIIEDISADTQDEVAWVNFTLPIQAPVITVTGNGVVQTADPDGIANNGDETYEFDPSQVAATGCDPITESIILTTLICDVTCEFVVDVNVFPPAQAPTITRDDDVCNYTITEACTGDVLDVTSTTAAPDSDPAPIDVTVTTANGCTATFPVDPSACPPAAAVCQGIDLAAGLPVIPTTVCSGATADICLTLIDAAEGLVITGTVDGAPVTLTGTPGAGANELCVTITAPANETCAPVDAVIQIDAIQCTDGTDYPGALGAPTLVEDLTTLGFNPLNVPVYPTLSVTATGDGMCGDLVAELVTADGTICATAAGSPFTCTADGETLDYDFTADVAAFTDVPADCPLPTLSGSLSCTGCTIMGCTDPCAPNYDPTAGQDDGSCEPYDMTCNADCTAGPFGGTWDPATCACINETTPISGCTDPTACNFDAAANCDNGTCLPAPTCNTDPCVGDIQIVDPSDACACITDTPQVLGCTDPTADNYNAAANCDDGSCMTAPVCDISVSISNFMCNDGGTPDDPTDDMVTFEYTVADNNGTGTTWSSDQGDTGVAYGAAISVGPVAADDTVWTINVNDDADSACTASVSQTLSNCATIANIPTVGEWGLIILGLLMSITAVVGIRQRREEEVYG